MRSWFLWITFSFLLSVGMANQCNNYTYDLTYDFTKCIDGKREGIFINH